MGARRRAMGGHHADSHPPHRRKTGIERVAPVAYSDAVIIEYATWPDHSSAARGLAAWPDHSSAARGLAAWPSHFGEVQNAHLNLPKAETCGNYSSAMK
jgi:hypothetical protein